MVLISVNQLISNNLAYTSHDGNWRYQIICGSARCVHWNLCVFIYVLLIKGIPIYSRVIPIVGLHLRLKC